MIPGFWQLSQMRQYGLFSHYNVDFVRSSDKKMTDEEIEEMFHRNREDAKNANLTLIQKKSKERHS